MKKMYLLFAMSSLLGLVSIAFGMKDDELEAMFQNDRVPCTITLQGSNKILVSHCNPATIVNSLNSYPSGTKDVYYGTLDIGEQDHKALALFLYNTSGRLKNNTFPINLKTNRAVIKKTDINFEYVFTSQPLLAIFESNPIITVNNDLMPDCNTRKITIIKQTTNSSSSSSETNSEEGSGSSKHPTKSLQPQPSLTPKPQQKISRTKNFLVYVPLGFVLGVLPFYFASRLGHWDSSFAPSIDAHFMQLFASLQAFAFRK